MKKTLLSLFLAMAVAAGASAAQQTEVDKGDRFDYKYPVFTQENPQAAQRMNRDIQNGQQIAQGFAPPGYACCRQQL